MSRTAHRFLLLLGLLIAVTLGFASVNLLASNDEPSPEWVTSVQPFYSSEDATSDASILGRWRFARDLTLTFTPAEKGAYTLLVTEVSGKKHSAYRFEAHLFRLGVDSFLDLHPTSIPDDAELYALFSFPCHIVAKVAFPDDQLQLRFLNASWLADQIKAGTVTISSVQAHGGILLTATTEEMQELLYLNASDEDVFSEHIEFDRADETPQDSDQEAQ